eukprot:4034085-Alexandrium_andersonii.AAC.1
MCPRRQSGSVPTRLLLPATLLTHLHHRDSPYSNEAATAQGLAPRSRTGTAPHGRRDPRAECHSSASAPSSIPGACDAAGGRMARRERPDVGHGGHARLATQDARQ